MVIQNLNEREREILEILMDNRANSVAEISKLLAVSSVTVRNNLNSLADKGVVVRTWGGAAPAFHPEIMARQRQMTEAKARIARAAAALVRDGDTLMIEAGTTTALIARYLFGKRDLFIVSNSNLVVPYTRANPALRLTLVGGEFRPSSESTVGPVALEQLERFHVRLAFVGTDGFSRENGLTTHLVEGAEIVKKMAAQAEQVVLTADSSKYGKSGFVRVLPLERMNRIITDEGLDLSIQDELRSQGLDVEIAKA
ncbi:MAG TPA: DeoR/GlpR family DNA-binding transcription regulator [Spirochaetia bacterium]|nr:DeoR/GlpR family DNA-binding transcription regulator [Spirochaetia bacterium]